MQQALKMTDKKKVSFMPLWCIILFAVGMWLILALVLIFRFSKILFGPHVEIDQADQFGDAFGSLNALFSGSALAGVIYATLLQRKELEYQGRTQRGEISAARTGRVIGYPTNPPAEPVRITGRTLAPGAVPPDDLAVAIRKKKGPEITRLRVTISGDGEYRRQRLKNEENPARLLGIGAMLNCAV